MFRLTPGRVIVVLIVLLGVSLAAFNVWFRYATTNEIHDRWGTEAMLRIADAPEASWWELTTTQCIAENDNGTLDVDGTHYGIVRRGDLIKSRGFVNLRYALGQNGSYNFSCDQAPRRQWKWAMVFATAEGRTVVLVDEEAKWLRALGALQGSTSGGEAVELTEKMSAGIKTFFAERSAAK